MDSDELRLIGKEMIDVVADYWESLRDRKPLPEIAPGFIKELVPSSPPSEPEDWEQIFKDVEPVVCAGNTHWQHPEFFAYYPTGCSYHSIVGDILSAGLASIGFHWKSSPSMTELELRMTDWLAKVLNLPKAFWNDSELPGGGIIQNTASDSTFVAILAARGRMVERIKEMEKEIGSSSAGGTCCTNQVHDDTCEDNAQGPDSGIDIGTICLPEFHDPRILCKLVAYCSDQAHSSVEKGAMLGGVRLRKLRSHRGGEYDNYRVTPQTLEAAIKEDRKNGLVPFIFVATVGTTSSCGVDPIDQLAPICNREGIWVHVDSAYAGSFMVCPEYQNLCRGIELVDSFNTNVHKSLMINFDCSPMWFKNAKEAIKYFSVEPPYLQHEHQRMSMDYRHLQIALGRRFRSLKVWFVLRNFGIERLREYQRKMITLAKQFEELIIADENFELFVPRQLGLVCFRLKNSTNEMNQRLDHELNNDRRIHLTASTVHGVFFLRLAICSPQTTEDDINNAYQLISSFAKTIITQ